MDPQETVHREIVIQDDTGSSEEIVLDLEQWLHRLVPVLSPDVDSFTARLAAAEEIHRLNRELRGKDRATDVLSFPGEETVEGRHLGDVLIALPIAVEQAVAAGHSLHRELQELLLHGVLHCLGYDHAQDNGEMNALELELRLEWIDNV